MHVAVQRAAVPEVFAAFLQGLRSDAALQSRCATAFCIDKQVKDADFSLTAAKKKSMGTACKYVLVAVFVVQSSGK